MFLAFLSVGMRIEGSGQRGSRPLRDGHRQGRVGRDRRWSGGMGRDRGRPGSLGRDHRGSGSLRRVQRLWRKTIMTRLSAFEHSTFPQPLAKITILLRVQVISLLIKNNDKWFFNFYYSCFLILEKTCKTGTFRHFLLFVFITWNYTFSASGAKGRKFESS